jgi:hypothetical protein
MRHVGMKFLTAALLGLLASPVFAQFGFFGSQDIGPSRLVINADVQKELKLSRDQVEKFTKATQEMRDKIREAIQGSGGDMDKFRKALAKLQAEGDKLVADTLKPEQLKRLRQIELQANGHRSFTRAEVQKELKLTDRQKKDVEKIADDVKKETEGLFKDVGRDREKFQEAQKKAAALNSEAVTKVTKLLSADQQKTWKALTGDKFDYKPNRGLPRN